MDKEKIIRNILDNEALELQHVTTKITKEDLMDAQGFKIGIDIISKTVTLEFKKPNNICTVDVEKIKNIITDISLISKENITLEDSLFDLGVDYLDLVEILMEIEEQFKVEISDDVFDRIDTLRDIIKALEKETVS